MYIFGGQGAAKFNDLWSWNTKDGWNEVIARCRWPSVNISILI